MLKISAVLIVKNEALHLGKCLEALSTVADEIIVADTGSEDDTIRIALNYTKNVVEIPWLDDFSLARNTAMSYARGEWILIVDADEIVTKPVEARQRLLSFTSKVDCIGTIHVQSPTILNGQQSTSNSHIKRFFPREGFSFRGRIHEQVECNHNAVGSARTGIMVEHSGYQHDTNDAGHKSHRNIPLLQRAVNERPGDEYLHFQLGRSYFTLAEYQQSIPNLETVLSLIQFGNQSDPQGIDGPVAREVLTNTIVSLAYAYLNTEQIGLARTLINHHQSMNHIGTRWADFHHLCGYLGFIEGNLSNAKAGYEASLRYGAKCEDVEGTGSHSSAYHLGLLAEVELDVPKALSCYAQAFKFKPDYKPALDRCIDLALENNIRLNEDLVQMIEPNAFHNACLEKKYPIDTPGRATNTTDHTTTSTSPLLSGIDPGISGANKKPLITIKQRNSTNSLS